MVFSKWRLMGASWEKGEWMVRPGAGRAAGARGVKGAQNVRRENTGAEKKLLSAVVHRLDLGRRESAVVDAGVVDGAADLKSHVIFRVAAQGSTRETQFGIPCTMEWFL
jgi:hypothetical protein